jgi:hypothetical protein
MEEEEGSVKDDDWEDRGGEQMVRVIPGLVRLNSRSLCID